MNTHHIEINKERLGSKQGLIRSFIVIVIGILLLSFLGFDLRTKVAEFRVDNQENISFVKQVLFDTIIPTTEDTIQDIKDFAAQNDITANGVKETVQMYFIKIRDLVEVFQGQ